MGVATGQKVGERLRRSGQWLLVLLWLCGWTACGEQSEGCLDYSALSVDITADRACDNCCRYPKLLLQLRPVVRSDTGYVRLERGRPLELPGGDTLRALELQFFVHDILLEQSGGADLLLTDSLTLVRGDSLGASAEVHSLLAFDLLRRSTGSIGRLRGGGRVEAISLVPGLPEALANLQPSLQQTRGPLSAAGLLTDTLTNTFCSAFWSYLMATGDTLQVALPQQEVSSSTPIRWALPESVELEPSYNLQVTARLDLSELFAEPPPATAAAAAASLRRALQDAEILSVKLSR